MADLFAAHDSDWARFAKSPEASAALGRWSDRHPALAAFDTVDTLLAAVADRRFPDTQDDLLLALLTEARDDLIARRAVLRAVTPGLVRLARSYRAVWGEADVDAMVAVAALERIAAYPLRRRKAVAANLVGDVRNQLHRARLRDQVSLAACPLRVLDTEAPTYATPSDEILELVARGVADGTLTPRAGRLIILHRIFDVRGPALAHRDGGDYEAVKKYRRRAEAALASNAAPEVA